MNIVICLIIIAITFILYGFFIEEAPPATTYFDWLRNSYDVHRL